MWQRHEDLGHGVKVDSSWWIVTKLAILAARRIDPRPEVQNLISGPPVPSNVHHAAE